MSYNLPVTRAFGHIGDVFYRVLKWPTEKVIRWAEHSGDGYAAKFVASKRPLYIMGGVTCAIFGTGFYQFTIKRIKFDKSSPAGQMMAQLYPFDEDSVIVPKLDAALKNALKYAQNGNVAQMCEYLSAAEEIVLEYPRYKSHIELGFIGAASHNPNVSKNENQNQSESEIENSKGAALSGQGSGLIRPKTISQMAQNVAEKNKKYISQVTEKAQEIQTQVQDSIKNKIIYVSPELESQLMSFAGAINVKQGLDTLSGTTTTTTTTQNVKDSANS